MIQRILILLLAAFSIAACSTTSTTPEALNGADENAVQSRYDVDSQGLEPFAPLDGSKAEAYASDRVFYNFDSSVITTRGQRTLDRQSRWLKRNSNINVTVQGHADERGTREYNLALGARRAEAVKRYLVNSGIAASRISTISYGKERPAVLGNSLQAYAENRRGVTVLNR